MLRGRHVQLGQILDKQYEKDQNPTATSEEPGAKQGFASKSRVLQAKSRVLSTPPALSTSSGVAKHLGHSSGLPQSQLFQETEKEREWLEFEMPLRYSDRWAYGLRKEFGLEEKKYYLHIGDYWSHKSRLTLFRENVSSKKKRALKTYS